MDIIITGGQGVGKTGAAQKLIAEHFGAKTIHDVTLPQLLVVTSHLMGASEDQALNVRVLAATIRAARVEAVYFDECLTDDTKLLNAVRAVKSAREQMGRNLYAVYVFQTNGELKIAQHAENLDALLAPIDFQEPKRNTLK